MNEFPCLMMIGSINPRSINPYVFCRFFTSIRLLIDLSIILCFFTSIWLSIDLSSII
ncbi:hypothetical protein HanIR_Chr04g0205791 [Helianthus annuus]|nr:hypothetical protein HanIR_Chr04g0205791 [Helianthus annuus]KAJ0598835.1 hypothetical protein HanHA89_Chr04g0170061 [Helianthus annuus]